MADPSKVQKILNLPTPTNLKEVQQFLGLVKYLNAFNKIKEIVISHKCLTVIDHDKLD